MVCTTWKRGNAQGYSCKTPNLQSHGDFSNIFKGNGGNTLSIPQGSWSNGYQSSSGSNWNWSYNFKTNV